MEHNDTEIAVGQLYTVANALMTPLAKFLWEFQVHGLENVPVDAIMIGLALRLDDLGKACQRISDRLLSAAAEVRERRTGSVDPEISELQRQNFDLF